MSKHVGEKSGKRADGESDRDPDGHHHTIIRPVWRWAYKNYIHEYFISPYTVRILIIECRMWCIPYLEILADSVTDFVTHQIIQKTHVISIVHVRVLLWELLKNVNRPKLFMITGRNGLYFLLRLGRLSYAIGFQSETLHWRIHLRGRATRRLGRHSHLQVILLRLNIDRYTWTLDMITCEAVSRSECVCMA